MGKDSNLVYLPFNNQNSEKLEIEDFKIVSKKDEEVHILLHKLCKQLDNGDKVHYYKATKFFKLMRVAKEMKQNNKMMHIHSDIIRGMYQAGVNFCQVICNVLKAEDTDAMGLLFFYGVQSVASTEEEAIRNCENDYQSLLRSFQATHRTAHITVPTYNEIFWMFKKMREQTHVTVVKGIPAVKQTSGQHKNIANTETSTEEQMEQFLAGLIGDEFLFLLMCTPIKQKALRGWLTNSLKEQTKWESQKQGSTSFSAGISVPMSMNLGGGTSSGSSYSQGESRGTSFNESHSETQSFGTNESMSVNQGTSENFGTNENVSQGTNDSFGTSDSQGSSHGTNVGTSGGASANGEVNFWGQKVNIGTNVGTSSGENWGTNESHSSNESHGSNYSESQGSSQSWGSNESQGYSKGFSASQGTSDGSSWGTNQGVNSSYSGNQGVSTNWGKSMGLAPNLSFGKSYQFTDVEVAYFCELLNTQNQRLKNMTEGEGGFFVDLYISCKDSKTQAAIKSLIVSTWVNPDSKIDVIHGEVPSRIEQKKLSLHMQALTPCLEMASNRIGKYYKYASILQSSEISAYSHPPRISMGGIDNTTEDRPKLRVPTNRQNKEIFIGNVINGEAFNIEQAKKYKGNGYMTDFKFGIGQNELHHAIISGQSGSGKTVLALRMITGLYNNTYTVDKITGEKKRKRILVLDPNGEWRQLGMVIPQGKFRFFSLADPHFHPLKMNLLRVPKYIRATDYYSMVTEMFCSAYGLLDRALAQIRSVIYDLYEQVGAFDNDLDPFYANERTKNVTFDAVYDKLVAQKEESLAKRDSHNVEAIQTYLTRLDSYKKEKSKEHIMFCNKGGQSIDEVLGKEDGVTVIESNGLDTSAQNFFFTLAMTSIFKYAQARGARGFYTAKDQYETYIVLEEANSVLISTSSGGDGPSASEVGLKRFEDLVNQSRKFGLYVWTLTQTIEQMPTAVIANSGLIFAGKSSREKDMDLIMKAVGKDGRYEDREFKKFFPRMPVGEFICKVSKSESELEQEPCMVKVSPLNVEVPDNDELENIIQANELAKYNND